jgi:hypothetical protein
MNRNNNKKIATVTKDIVVVSIGILLLLFTTLMVLTQSNHSLTVRAQQKTVDKTYHSNATGATITFHDHSITSKTSNVTHTNTSGISGFGPQNSMRNMTNPMYLMKRNPLANLSNPLGNMKNPLAK